MAKNNDWLRLLGYVTGLVNQELLLRNEYLVAENRVLKTIQGRLRLSQGEKAPLAEIAKRLGAKPLRTSLVWRSRTRFWPGIGSWSCRSSTVPNGAELWAPAIRAGHRGAGSEAGPGKLRLGLRSDHRRNGQSGSCDLRRIGGQHSAPSRNSAAPERKKNTTWKDFIRAHMSVLAGTDFFTAEVLTWHGLVTYYVLFFVHLDSRRVSIAGITDHPESCWMEQMARNLTLEGWGFFMGAVICCTIGTRSSVSRRSQGSETAGAQPEFERLRVALGALGERGMPLQVSALWAGLAAESAGRIRRAFPRRAESSGQRERAVISWHRQILWQRQRSCALPGAAGWPPEALPPRGRMNWWAIRHFFGKEAIQIRRFLGRFGPARSVCLESASS